MENILGTEQSEILEGSSSVEKIIGLAGDDTINAGAGDDVIIGDYTAENLLSDADGSTSFAQYGEGGAWSVVENADGSTEMSQTVTTLADSAYTISFETAANYGANALSGVVEVLWNGEVIDTFDTNSALFEAHSISFAGTGEPGQLTFRARESEPTETGPVINTDGPAFWYEKTMQIGGEDVAVKAFAEGQTNIYQAMYGTLHVFDVESETYSKAGVDATVKINAIGFNQEDDLIYGIAVGNGVDALGNTVGYSDVMMIDAEGNSYRVGSSPYNSWTADFDDKGNLWSFHSSLDRMTMIDVDQFDANGDPVSVTYKFPQDMITDKMWDVAFDATTQTFYGIVKANKEGGQGKLYTIDISDVANGGEPSFSSQPIVAAEINGEMKEGLPKMTFGALILDSDGNLYAGGNGGDHDMDDSTGTSGGIYRLDTDPDTGEIILRLVADAPKAYSNDGAMDPRSIDPFTEVDTSAAVLIRSPEFVATPDADTSYDDNIEAGGGKDVIQSGFGEDLVVGASLGDTIDGGAADDALYGGAGPDYSGGMVSVYDEDGLRYDPFGNLLPEDDDVIYGGVGNDFLSGSAGHDILSGDEGDDVLEGGTGSDTLSGGDGDDSLSGGSQDDVLFGDLGNDIINGGTGDDLISGGDGDDTVKGGSNNDTIDGGTGNDTIDGGSGDDDITGGLGNDKIKAGSGNDTVDAGEGNDYINAFKGDDVIDGGAGRDKILAGAGSDVITGGDESDTFVFRSEDNDGSIDKITDFTRSGGENDRLDLRALDLVGAAETEADWISTNVSQAANGNVTVDLGKTSIVMVDHDELGSIFLEDVLDGLLL